MKRTKKLLVGFLATLSVLSGSLGLAACDLKLGLGNGVGNQNSSSAGEETEIERVYAQYVVYAQAAGEEPLSYEEWLASIKGEKGDKGDTGAAGADGVGIKNAYINEDGELIVELTVGEPKNLGKIVGEDGAQGEKGEKGDTGAQGEKGEKGDTGVGVKNIYINEDGELIVELTEGEPKNLGKIFPEQSVEPTKSASIGLDFTDKGSHYLVSGIGACGDTDLIFPEEYEGKPVMGIESGAFKSNSNITSVVIPNTYTIIRSAAFAWCKKLLSVEMSQSIRYIGDSAFSYCSALRNFVLPDNVLTIGHSAFSGCDSLTSIIIPDSVTSIDSYAFSYCDSLTSVVIGQNVTSIGNYAFDGCDSLTGVYYKGTASDWAEISIDNYNSYLTNETRYYYSENDPTTTGNYWHYNEQGEMVVWESEN